MKRLIPAWTGVVCLGLVLGCGPLGPTGAMEETELYNSAGLQGRPLFDPLGMAVVSMAERPFVRVGLMWDAEAGTALEGRVMDAEGRWGEWRPIEAYWQEGVAHAGHLDVQSGLGHGFQLRLADGSEPSHVVAEAIERLGEWSAGELPQEPEGASPEGTYGTLAQALAPSSLVRPRADWGARAPRCSSSAHTPNRVTVHHTATPLPDSMTPQARLRQIQSYHMYTQGWCDIGYHLLVDWNGNAWQGRNERVLGAHVANQNSGNVGLSYLGTYTSRTPSAAQITKGARILRWLNGTYGIALTRTKIKGHRQLASTACPGDKLYAKLDAMVNEAKGSSTGGSTPKGTLSGTVFRDKGQGTADMSTRLPGATISVSGAGSKTAAAGDASWTFSLDPKTYTVTASLSGYNTASRSCKVESGKTTWCSIGLVKTVQPGTIRGVVFEDVGVGTADMSRRLGGASVSISGQGSVTAAAADAAWSKNVPPGTYTVRASKSGFTSASRSCQVTSGATTWCSLGLVRLSSYSGEGQVIEEETPPEGTRVFGFVMRVDPLSEEQALLEGQPIAGALVAAPGGEATHADGLGAFELRLAPGVHELRAVAEGYGDGLVECEVPAEGEVECGLALVRLEDALSLEANEPDGEASDPSGPDPGAIVGGCATGGQNGAPLFGLGLLLLILGLRRRPR
jgi:uncharacterized protein (TIGR03382 family)